MKAFNLVGDREMSLLDLGCMRFQLEFKCQDLNGRPNTIMVLSTANKKNTALRGMDGS
jgi:hypothetical protein